MTSRSPGGDWHILKADDYIIHNYHTGCVQVEGLKEPRVSKGNEQNLGKNSREGGKSVPTSTFLHPTHNFPPQTTNQRSQVHNTLSLLHPSAILPNPHVGQL